MRIPPTALYVHIPFCVRRCDYCAFASIRYDYDLAGRYLLSLEREVARRTAGFQPATIYVGGGTPTCLGLDQWVQLAEILARVDQSQTMEYTVEANPGTVTMDKLMLLRTAGVTRISIGVQTFQERGLRLLGRIHSAREARTAVALCREAGFDEITIDMIFGWPGQTPDEWKADLDKAIALDAPHVSAYGLTLERRTPLHELVQQGKLCTPGEDEALAMFERTAEVLGAAGLRRYEISNFARPGHACVHNLNYWIGGGYIGLGAAAHSHVDGVRYANRDAVKGYIDGMQTAGSAREFEEKLTPERHARECAVVWLRLADGIPADAFAERTGFDLERLLATDLPPLLDGGWLAWHDDHARLALTRKALPVADSVLAELVGEA